MEKRYGPDLFLILLPMLIAGSYLFIQPELLPIGAQDFIEYWTSWQLFSSGRNPYDPQAMMTLQQSLRPETATPLMMWNPPWIFLFLWLPLQFDFPAASGIWLTFNIGFLAATAVLCRRLYFSDLAAAKSLPLILCCLLPVAQCLLLGQIGLLLALSVALLLWSLRHQKDPISGLTLVPLSLKPHLFYLFGLVLFWWICRERRYRILAWAFVFFSAAVFWCEWLAPGSVSRWLDTMQGQKDGSVHIFDWAVGTLVGAVRQGIWNVTGVAPAWPALLIPAITAIMTLMFLLSRSRREDWQQFFPPVLALSVFTSPFGWIFDSSCLLVTHASALSLALLSNAPSGSKRIFLGAVLAAQLLSLLAANLILTQHSALFFFPGMLAVFWFAAFRMNRKYLRDNQ